VRRATHKLDPKDKRKKLDLLAETLVASGLNGDITALKEIGDRLDGRVPQALTGENGGPIRLGVSWLQPSA
jgi:hypothetical protein